MTYKKTSKLIDILYGIAAFIAILGVIFKIINLPYSNIFLAVGLFSAALLGFKEIKRLKKVISVLTETLH